MEVPWDTASCPNDGTELSFSTAAEPEQKDPLVGMMLGEYLVQERLGVGGMGIVYAGLQPVIGKKVYGVWSQAHTDLPAVVQSIQPKVGDLSRKALAMVAGIGGAVLLFLASFIIAGIIMAFGHGGARSTRSIFDRVVGVNRGEEFARLCTQTIRAVAQGVLGVAFIQAIVVGVVMLVLGRRK
jgi:predicted PurR-regulated permease PerM